MADDTDDPDRSTAAMAFNEVWSYLDAPSRTAEEVEAMIDAAHASLWHWRRSPACTPDNVAIGLWQVSRAYAVAGRAGEALLHARRCVAASGEAGAAWLKASAREALARALLAAGMKAEAREAVEEARGFLAAEADTGNRGVVEADLATLDLG